jgi:hypothetical protein
MFKLLLTVTLLAALQICSAATPHPDLNGIVVDENGKPLAHATVMVYHAGVKHGYSTFCPSCYIDCGKRVVTNAKGSFSIKSLDPDLRFELLAARDGYIPEFAKDVDPVQNPTVTIKLSARPKAADFSGIVRGRVVDADGSPIRDAVIKPQGVLTNEQGDNMIGELPGLEPVAVSNERGEFEVAYAKPTPKMLLNIEARAMAPKFVVMATGKERHSVILADGAAITGRLLANGKPVGNAEIALIPKHRGGFGENFTASGDPYPPIRIGTNRDGTFTITNVPEPVDWYLYAEMNTIMQLGATEPLEVKTASDKEFLRAGDLTVRPGYRLKGKVLLSDQKAIPDGMRITISSERVADSQTAVLGRDGSFEFANLPPGPYSIFTSVKGYQVKGPENIPYSLPTISMDHDVDGFTLTAHPQKAPAKTGAPSS